MGVSDWSEKSGGWGFDQARSGSWDLSRGSICACELRIRNASQSSGEPGSSSSKRRIWHASIPSAESLPSATPVERARHERRPGFARWRACRQAGADDGSERAVERVGVLGRAETGVRVDLFAQLVTDGPGDEFDGRQGLGRDNGIAHRVAPRNWGWCVVKLTATAG